MCRKSGGEEEDDRENQQMSSVLLFLIKCKTEVGVLQVFSLWVLSSLRFHASQFLVNPFHLLKLRIVLEEFVNAALIVSAGFI